MSFQTLNIELHRFLRICQGFLSSRPLRNAPWQSRNLGHKNAVFILLDEYPEFDIAHFPVPDNRLFPPKMLYNTSKIATIQYRCNQYWSFLSSSMRRSELPSNCDWTVFRSPCVAPSRFTEDRGGLAAALAYTLFPEDGHLNKQ